MLLEAPEPSGRALAQAQARAAWLEDKLRDQVQANLDLQDTLEEWTGIDEDLDTPQQMSDHLDEAKTSLREWTDVDADCETPDALRDRLTALEAERDEAKAECGRLGDETLKLQEERDGALGHLATLLADIRGS